VAAQRRRARLDDSEHGDGDKLHRRLPHLATELQGGFTTTERRRCKDRWRRRNPRVSTQAAALESSGLGSFGEKDDTVQGGALYRPGQRLDVRAKKERGTGMRCGSDPSLGAVRCDRRWGMTGGPHLSAAAGEGRGTRACAGPQLGRSWTERKG
jgi:hypothetical protein